MAKRRTREQKIIAKLRRQLKSQQAISQTPKVDKVDKPTLSPFVKLPSLAVKPKNEPVLSKKEILTYDPKLIKKDLKKTLILSLFFLLLIISIQQFFHL